MKTPDIPQECGLKLHADIGYANAWDANDECIYFDLETKSGRAALAAYCMAVIDEMIREVGELLQEFDLASDDFVFWWEVWESLVAWKEEFVRYGGFTQ